MPDTPVKFRPVRGAFADAMKEFKEFESLEAMKAHVLTEHVGHRIFSQADLFLKPQGYDKREGWEDETWLIVSPDGPVGYTNKGD